MQSTRTQKSCNCWEATLSSNRKDYHHTWSTRASTFTSQNHVFGIMLSFKYRDAILELLETIVFITYSAHSFTNVKASKKHTTVPWSKNNWPLHKTTPNCKHQYFFVPLTSPPLNKNEGFQWHFQDLAGTSPPLPRLSLTSHGPQKDPKDAPRHCGDTK